MCILRQVGVFRPVGGDWGGEAVCGRSVAGGFRRGGITDDTAEIPSACGRCNAGMQQSGSRSAGPNPRDARGTRRRSASGESSGHLSPRSHLKVRLPLRTRLRRLARGHAAKKLPRFFVTAQAVTNPSGILLVPLRRIVAMTVARPCVRPGTANVSG